MNNTHTYHNNSKKVVIIGDNFILKNLYTNFKRYSKKKIYTINNIKNLKIDVDYIIDCTFNEKQQNDTIGYSLSNKIDKVIILCNKSRTLPKNIIQVILPDVYHENHNSFNRVGSGNSEDIDISHNNLICEVIRRTHESKINGTPNTYINYNLNNIKYIFNNNIYNHLIPILDNTKNDNIYDIYDNEESIGTIIQTIKDIVDYNGELILNNTQYKNFNIREKQIENTNNNFQKNIRTIYKRLLINNDRFKI